MKLSEALEILIGRTRHEKYRDFVDPTNAAYHPAWEAEVIRLANEEPPAPPPVKDEGDGRNLRTGLAGWYWDSIAMFRRMYGTAITAPADKCCGQT